MNAIGIETEQEVDGRWIAEDKTRPGMMAYGATKVEAALAVDNMRLRKALAELGGTVAALLAAHHGGFLLSPEITAALTSAEAEARAALKRTRHEE